MPIDSATKVYTWRDNDFGVEILSPGDLNRLRADVKQAFDLKFDRPDKPWSKGDLIWYDGVNWQILSGGDDDQLLSYTSATNVPTWKTLSIDVVETFEFEGTPADGDILWYDGSDWVLFNRGTQDQVFSLDSNREPLWRDVGEGFDFAGSTQRGDILYYGSSSTWRLLRKGTSGQIMEQGSNDPRWINKPAAGNRIAYHTKFPATSEYAEGIGDKRVLQILQSDMVLIPGTRFEPFGSETRDYHLVSTLTYTPNSSTSKIKLTCFITVLSGNNSTYRVIPFIILDGGIVNYSNIKNNFPPSTRITTSANIAGNIILKYDYSLSTSSLKTIKLYVASRLDATEVINILSYYMEAIEIY